MHIAYVPRSTTCYREARPLSANSSFCVAYVEPPLRSFELSEKEACLTECGILESTEPPLNLVESSQRSSLSERVRPFAKTLGLFQLTGAARPLSFFYGSTGTSFSVSRREDNLIEKVGVRKTGTKKGNPFWVS